MTTIEDVMKSADNYAHVYAFVGDDTMPITRASLRAAIEQYAAEREREARANASAMITLIAERVERLTAERDALQAKLDALPKMYSELRDNVPDHKSYEGYAEGWVDACNECEWALNEK